MQVVCLDLEGVLVPEIWIGVAERTGIQALRATTRDIADYDQLMRQRLRLLTEHNLGMADVQDVIKDLRPLDGAAKFLAWLRERFQVIILSDTFYEFAKPLMAQLDWPTIFCHRLEEDAAGRIVNYSIRLPEHKRHAVDSLKALNFKVMAAGDSFNDTGMLGAADRGFFLHAPENVTRAFPQFKTMASYGELKAAIEVASRELAD